MAKKKKKSFSFNFGFLRKLMYLAVFIVIFIALGGFDIKGRTPLEHLDNLFKTDVLQDTRDGLVNLVYNRDIDIDLKSDVDSLEDGAKELFKETKDGGKKILNKVKKSSHKAIDKPMEHLTADDEDDIQKILKEKARKNRE